MDINKDIFLSWDKQIYKNTTNKAVYDATDQRLACAGAAGTSEPRTH